MKSSTFEPDLWCSTSCGNKGSLVSDVDYIKGNALIEVNFFWLHKEEFDWLIMIIAREHHRVPRP